MRYVVPLLLLVAACGGDGAATDGGVGPDATLPCGEELCGALGASCGTTVDSCGAEVDCGTCEYVSEPIGTLGVRPAIDVGEELQVAYVETSPSHELRLAVRGDAGWVSETVTALDGPPLGPIDLAVTTDGTRWIAFVDEAAQVRVATAPKGGGWTVGDSLGAGVSVAIALGGDVPVLAVSGVVDGTQGVFVLVPEETSWLASPVGEPTVAGAPAGLGLAVRGENISVAWRDPGANVVRYAVGKGAVYTIEVVDPVAPAPREPGALGLAIGALGRPHIVYGRRGQLVYAVRTGEIWHRTPFGFAAADGDDAIAIGPDRVIRVAAFDDDGLRMLDGIAGMFLSQPVSTRCTDGLVDVGVSVDGSVHVVEACDDGIAYLRRAGPE